MHGLSHTASVSHGQTDRHREVTDQEYIPYPYITSTEGVKKLTNTEMPLNFNVIFLSVSDSCRTTAQKDVGSAPHTEGSKYPMTPAGKYADCSATHVNSIFL